MKEKIIELFSSFFCFIVNEYVEISKLSLLKIILGVSVLFNVVSLIKFIHLNYNKGKFGSLILKIKIPNKVKNYICEAILDLFYYFIGYIVLFFPLIQAKDIGTDDTEFIFIMIFFTLLYNWVINIAMKRNIFKNLMKYKNENRDMVRVFSDKLGRIKISVFILSTYMLTTIVGYNNMYVKILVPFILGNIFSLRMDYFIDGDSEISLKDKFKRDVNLVRPTFCELTVIFIIYMLIKFNLAGKINPIINHYIISIGILSLLIIFISEVVRKRLF